MIKNPLAIIGLDPGALNGLNNAQIETLINGMVRTLQKVCHPDIVGNNTRLATRSQEVNQAFELLNRKKYPEAFKRYIADYQKKTPQKEKIAELENQLVEYQKHQYVAYEDTFTVLSQRQGETKDPEEIIKIHNPWVLHDITRWVNNTGSKKGAFFQLTIRGTEVIAKNNEPLDFNKRIIGTISETNYSMIVSPELKRNFSDIKNKVKIAGTQFRSGKIAKYQGPVITKDLYYIIAPYIRYDIYNNGYVITMNWKKDMAYVQIEGSITTYTTEPLPT